MVGVVGKVYWNNLGVAQYRAGNWRAAVDAMEKANKMNEGDVRDGFESGLLQGLSLHVVFMFIPMLHNFKREQHAEILRDLTQICGSGGLMLVAHQTHSKSR